MTSSASLHALLTGAIDYAGLFPPAKLSMRDAVARYADYREATEAWALGRFVIPLARLDEFAVAQRTVGSTTPPWRLSVLLGDDPVADSTRLRDFNVSHARAAIIDSAELKIAGPPSAARRLVASAIQALPPSVRLYVEVPLGDELSAYLAVLASENARAKVRTGGVTADAFPDVRQLARFLLCCADHDTQFKATAGLHHPWRGRYPLTYEPQAQVATMFGFLNVLLAAALARTGGNEDDVASVLEAEQGSEFRFSNDEVRWQHLRIDRQTLLESHATFALSFGSCSFEEPIADLRRLALL